MNDVVAKNIDGKSDTQTDVAQEASVDPTMAHIAPLSVLRGLRRTHALWGWF